MDRLPTKLQDLINQWDALAHEAGQRGDAKQERYYYGVMYGLEAARDDLADLLTEVLQAETSKRAQM